MNGWDRDCMGLEAHNIPHGAMTKKSVPTSLLPFILLSTRVLITGTGP